MNEWLWSADLATDVDSYVSLIMAIIFFAAVLNMYLPSVNVNGLRRYIAAMMITAALLFVVSAAWLLVDDVLNWPYTPVLIWVRALVRVSNLIATIIFAHRMLRHERPVN